MQIRFDKDDMFYGAPPKLFERAKQLRNAETRWEKLLWERLSKNQLLGFRFRRQHPIKYFIADFYCHELKLILEIDGGIHNTPGQFEYDQGREFELNALGLVVIRFTNEEIEYQRNKVIDQIEIVIASSLKRM